MKILPIPNFLMLLNILLFYMNFVLNILNEVYAV